MQKCVPLIFLFKKARNNYADVMDNFDDTCDCSCPVLYNYSRGCFNYHDNNNYYILDY